MLFMAAIQKPLNTIPYRGGGPVIQALAGSQVDIGCEQATTAAPLVAGKRVKGYAVSRSSRLASLPDLPTAAEAGLKGFDISVWHGLYVPAGTPPAIVQALSKALAEALKDPTLAKRFNDISTEPTPAKATPQALRDLLHSEIDRWTPLIRAAGEYAD
jgi:tripartite-type tricarboxylate transporter receptor subunit TctC